MDDISDDQRAEVIRQAHAAGLENMKFHIECGDALRSESNTTLTILLAGALGSLGFAFTKLGAVLSSPTGWGSFAMAAYLLGVSFLLVRNCLKPGSVFPAHNEPSVLNQQGKTWAQILESELLTLQMGIDDNRVRNDKIGTWLINLRYAAFCAPLIWLAVMLLASVVKTAVLS